MWYAVNLWFEGVHAAQPVAQNLWEERLVLLQADSESAVRERAESLGKAEEHDYISATGDSVHCVFRQVERVYPIESERLENGVELFSRFLRADEIKSIAGSLSSATTHHSKTA